MIDSMTLPRYSHLIGRLTDYVISNTHVCLHPYKENKDDPDKVMKCKIQHLKIFGLFYIYLIFIRYVIDFGIIIILLISFDFGPS